MQSVQFNFLARPKLHTSPLLHILTIKTWIASWNPSKFIFFHPSSSCWRRPTGGGAAEALSRGSQDPVVLLPDPPLSSLVQAEALHAHPFPSIYPLHSVARSCFFVFNRALHLCWSLTSLFSIVSQIRSSCLARPSSWRPHAVCSLVQNICRNWDQWDMDCVI